MSFSMRWGRDDEFEIVEGTNGLRWTEQQEVEEVEVVRVLEL